MSTPIPPKLLAGAVEVGMPLPPLLHEVSATTVVLGALASRDWRPMHHDKDFAVQRNGMKDIFINTPNNAAWFERYLSDWTGPHGRLGRLSFQMKTPVFPGDQMRFSGVVTATQCDDSGCCWVEIDLAIHVGELLKTPGKARVALPANAGDNPWQRRGERWKP
jgi:acyl dehydratase